MEYVAGDAGIGGVDNVFGAIVGVLGCSVCHDGGFCIFHDGDGIFIICVGNDE